MDIFDMLNKRKVELYKNSTNVRENISQIIDDDSFVELNTFSFIKNDFYSQDVNGLGVVTGYATIDGFPIYVIAQNGAVLDGGLSSASCQKILNCQKKAIEANVPVVYLLDSKGVQVGEGVSILESISSILASSVTLKDIAPQFAVATGDVYGSLSLLFANCEYAFTVKDACVSYASPAVVSASSKEPLLKEVIGGQKSQNGLSTFAVQTLSEVKSGIVKILNDLPQISGGVVDCQDDLNRYAPELNLKIDAQTLITAVYDKDTFVELNKNFNSEVITGVGRVGGISTAVLLFDGGEEGVELTLNNVIKVKNFATYCVDNNLPLLTFVNTKGVKQDAITATSPILTEITNMLYNLSNTTRISVIYGNAIGFGYTAFASRNFGNAYTYAFAGAKVSLFDKTVGASVTYNTIDNSKLCELEEKYAEMQDAFNSAKLGYIDNVIEPQFVRQHVISVLQTLI